MRRERNIIVYIATSADGYIARRDGSVEWLNRPRTAGDYGMGAFFRSIDTILWGRKTYDQHVIPTFIGEGVPLIAPRHRDVPLALLSTHSYPDGVVRLPYAVRRARAAGGDQERHRRARRAKR